MTAAIQPRIDTFTSRLYFAAVVRRAIAERTLVSYARSGYERMMRLSNGDVLTYAPVWAQADPRRG